MIAKEAPGMEPIDEKDSVQMNLVDEYIGKRFIYEDDFGTIKYFGPVEGKKGQWYGIEWDTRKGKHSGTIGNKQYFQTLIPDQGSFISSNKQLNFGQSFEQALKQKYLSKITDKNIENSMINRKIESVGFEKVEEKLSNLKGLTIVGLASMKISIPTRCNYEITDIDLSRNLFNSIKQVWEICQQMNSLSILRLSYSRLAIPTLNLNFISVKVLVLNECLLSWQDVQNLSQWFPQLIELHLSGNNFTKILPLQKFTNLVHLNLESNNIKDFETLFPLNLTSLNLSNNKIKKINTIYNQIEILNLESNVVNDWDSIHLLNHFKKLKNLRIDGNPIINSLAKNKRSIIIGRIGNITKLKGSEISVKDRLDSDLYYLHKCLDDEDLGLHPRYKELCDIYGVPVKSKEFNTVADKLIELVLVDGELEVKKKVYVIN
jgi:hypothetical protein